MSYRKINILVAFLMLSTYYMVLLAQSYPIVDTGVETYYDDKSVVSEPSSGDPFFGQDAHYNNNIPNYRNNGDGTISDLVTGLMWQRTMGPKLSYQDALTTASALSLGGHSDWRMPTIKELYSLILFTGTVCGEKAESMFIDTNYFDQPIGDVSAGEREIDAQTWSSTQYRCLTMMGDSTVFGVNFVDGRIKGYPKYDPRSGGRIPQKMYARYVRGNTLYGQNDFEELTDVVIDNATGLMWQKADDGNDRNWEDALAYAEGLSLEGHDDWRLPNAKELQSIVDYTRCPDFSGTAAIDPVFDITEVNDYHGNPGHYPYFWTSTPHIDKSPTSRNPLNRFQTAVYLTFGEAHGEIGSALLDVHGAGSQRSDPKAGSRSVYPKSAGPQGDIVNVYNHVRCVRNLMTSKVTQLEKTPQISIFPNPANGDINLSLNFNYTGWLNLKIIDNLGKTILYRKEPVLKNKPIIISYGHLPAGLYRIILHWDNKRVTKQLAIQN